MAVAALVIAVAAFLLAAVTFGMAWWFSRPEDGDDPWECGS